MTLTPFQRDQIGRILGFALHEIQLRIARQQHTAASDLAYACHNLPSLHPEHFRWDYFRRWFTRFHELHGQLLYNYLAMLDTTEKGAEISFEIATTPLGEITPIAHEFITWPSSNNRNA
jgi:hypothetical protein